MVNIYKSMHTLGITQSDINAKNTMAVLKQKKEDKLLEIEKISDNEVFMKRVTFKKVNNNRPKTKGNERGSSKENMIKNKTNTSSPMFPRNQNSTMTVENYQQK